MPTMTTEVEFKYEIPADFELPDLTGVTGVAGVDEPTSLRLNATYYDTAGLRLAAHRATLRRRTGGHDSGWTLKRPAGADRSETSEPLSRRVREVPSTLAAEVAAVTKGESLVPVARIRTLRREQAVRDEGGAVLALIAHDTVTADALSEPPRRQRWRELEVELVNGPRDVLDAIGERLRAAGARPANSPSKLARALDDRYPPQAATPRPSGMATRAITDYLRHQGAAVAEHDPKVRAGDPDGVHDMRVATRRLRATLRTFRSVLHRDRTDPLRGELHWLAGVLGAVRDGDVIGRRLGEEIDDVKAASPEVVIGPVADRIRERLLADQARARADLDSALTGARYVDLRRAIAELPDVAVRGVSRGQLLRDARRALRRADRHLERAFRTPATQTGTPLPSPVPANRDVALHEARKAYKRARYAVEVVTPLVGRDGSRLSKRLATLQDVLGGHQDAVVAAGLLRDFGARAFLDGDNTFTYGVLYARARDAAVRQLTSLDRAHRRASKRSLRRRLKP
jgi:CHAD domain-containing protein